MRTDDAIEMIGKSSAVCKLIGSAYPGSFIFILVKAPSLSSRASALNAVDVRFIPHKELDPQAPDQLALPLDQCKHRTNRPLGLIQDKAASYQFFVGMKKRMRRRGQFKEKVEPAKLEEVRIYPALWAFLQKLDSEK